MSKIITARNLFAVHANLTRGEAERIVEKLPEDFIDELCGATPQAARHAVQKTYSKYLQALGNAAKAAEQREVTPELGESDGTKADPERRDPATGSDSGGSGVDGNDGGSGDANRDTAGDPAVGTVNPALGEVEPEQDETEGSPG